MKNTLLLLFIIMVFWGCDPVAFCLPDRLLSGNRFGAEQEGVTWLGVWYFQESGSFAITFDDGLMTGSWSTNCTDSLYIDIPAGDFAYKIDSVANSKIYLSNDFGGGDSSIRITLTEFKIPD